MAADERGWYSSRRSFESSTCLSIRRIPTRTLREPNHHWFLLGRYELTILDPLCYSIVGAVEQWVIEPEFKELKAQKALAWQDDDESETKVIDKEDVESEGGFENSTVGPTPIQAPSLVTCKD